jgi:hypothetical protein
MTRADEIRAAHARHREHRTVECAECVLLDEIDDLKAQQQQHQDWMAIDAARTLPSIRVRVCGTCGYMATDETCAHHHDGPTYVLVISHVSPPEWRSLRKLGAR